MDRIKNIDYCIRYLMEQDGVSTPVPDTLSEKQMLLRTLMNVWEPQPLSTEFIEAQNAELQAQLVDKGIVENVGNLWQGDITRLKVDAIVNAANSQGLGCWHPLHSCIDNAIHSAAGLQLRQACNDILQGSLISTGDAIITPGYNLPAQWVLHTVGPIVVTPQPTYEQERQLAECYHSCLQLAESHGCRSIAFCCISTGEYHFPNLRAAQIAVEACHNTQLNVVFNVFKNNDYAIYSELLGTPRVIA
ncbi:MAG: macro domain-containing protein [Bacteroidales bacterium]|nr:macro domain-containing protein [Prevotella sp.]MBQ9865036.1 macro domain-containing protein [Bacteroidales bacterium]